MTVDENSVDQAKEPPVVILVRPTLSENIGAAARAMMNLEFWKCGSWSPKAIGRTKAINTASGAERVLEQAKIYSTTQDAMSDLQRLYATTARVRDMEKPVLAPRELARTLHSNAANGEKSGILFGRRLKD